MKLFFISDIHGSVYYLNKALERFEEEGAHHIVVLGDLLYHGARNPLPKEYNPKEVTKILNRLSHKIIAVRGNCDSEVDQMVLDFPIMADYSTILYEGKRLFLTHGHIYNEGNIPKLRNKDVLIYGHTHIPTADIVDNIFVINPGSITLPKENNPHTYGVLRENIFQIKDLDGKMFKEIRID